MSKAFFFILIDCFPFYFSSVQLLLGLHKDLQMEEIASPSHQGEPRLLARTAQLGQQRVHQADPVQSTLQLEHRS